VGGGEYDWEYVISYIYVYYFYLCVYSCIQDKKKKTDAVVSQEPLKIQYIEINWAKSVISRYVFIKGWGAEIVDILGAQVFFTLCKIRQLR
jgi:hypothetical protein